CAAIDNAMSSDKRLLLATIEIELQEFDTLLGRTIGMFRKRKQGVAIRIESNCHYFCRFGERCTPRELLGSIFRRAKSNFVLKGRCQPMPVRRKRGEFTARYFAIFIPAIAGKFGDLLAAKHFDIPTGASLGTWPWNSTSSQFPEPN